MCKTICLFMSVLVCQSVSQKNNEGWGFVGNPLAFFYPCKGNNDIIAQFESGRPPENENQYNLRIQEDLPKYTRIHLGFDSDATVKLLKTGVARISLAGDKAFFIHFYNDSKGMVFDVKGPPYGTVPYLTTININNVEYCKEPNVGFLDNYIEGIRDTAEISVKPPDGTCGRRQIAHTELIVNGQPTTPGDWPWHVAMYRVEGSSIKYICGGTLLSKFFVLTAAHCVIHKGVTVSPDTRNIVLGKYNLVGGDVATQEREVNKIIVHEKLTYPRLDNDIALIKLKTEVVFGEYVQPACLWYSDAIKKLPSEKLFGTVVGWGFDQTDELATTLQQITMPIISDNECIKSSPLFFSKLLNNSKFCAGYRNGTSACNGDSGGGFVIFVPDTSHDTSLNATGAWYVRGIVSISIKRPNANICDPNQYSLLTDVAHFKGWIEKYVNE